MNDAWKLILGVLLLLVAFGKIDVPSIVPQPVVPPPPVVVIEPDTSPFRSKGLTILVVEDSSQRRSLPQSQVNIFTSAAIRSHLTNDLKAEFRFWNVNTDGAMDKPVFQDAAKVKRDSLPWIVIAHGKRGFSGPLPASVDDFIALVDQYK